MATFAEEYSPGLDKIPVEAILKPIYELQSMDVSSPLVIKDDSRQLDYNARQRNTHGIPSGIQEMLCVFDACIQVGRLERASMVLKRLHGPIRPHELIELHDRYLEAKLIQMQSSEGVDRGDDLHQWFELQIRSNELPHTDDTIALLLKAALLGMPAKRPLRVKRYMSMLDQETALEQLYIQGLLTTDDLAAIAQICPEYSMQVDPSLWEEDPAADQDSYHVAGKPVSRTTPEVLSTPQKGMGLKVLRQTLSIFSEIPEGGNIASLPKSQRREIQARLEKDCVDAAMCRWREENQALLEMGLNTSLSNASLSSRLYDWQRALESRLIDELALVDASETTDNKSPADLDRCVYGPFLRLGTPSRLAATTIMSTLSAMAMGGVDKGVPLSLVVGHVAKAAEEDIRLQVREKAESSAKLRGKIRNPRRMTSQKPQAQLADGQPGSMPSAPGATPDSADTITRPSMFPDEGWTAEIKVKVGCALFQALMETAKINVVREHPETKALVTQDQQAFTHTMQLKKGRKIGTVVANRALVDLMRQEPNGDYLARYLPMVVEPEPWTKFDKGGFIVSPASLVRVKNGERDQKIYADAALVRGDLDQVLRGLDVLGKTAWVINRPVFEVMLQAWNSGEEIASFPALNPTFNLPPEPDTNEDPALRRAWIKAVKTAENEKSGLHSERCFMNFQLEIARAFREQTFYFPHNIDFRGRAYPIPAYLNHMGADHVRGLLSFAKGKTLGESGLRWLKVHVANVFGFDKASLLEREQFAVDNLENIRESAVNPLGGGRWWLQAEDPWQCLAACFEIKAAMELPDPTQYVSNLPVHQDGTCNGLQHYAALGGDVWGAQQVNLVPGDRPADVYSAVAKAVEELIAADANDGIPIANFLKGKITRKVVKQTVMTNVYGVTFIGAKKQVSKQLEALYPDLPTETGLEHYVLSHYVTKKIFQSLSDMFRGAHDIQTWLGEIGNRVCKSVTPEQMQDIFASPEAEAAASLQELTEPAKKGRKAKPKAIKLPAAKGAKLDPSTRDLVKIQSLFRSGIVWTTPLRMPVVQPYRKSGVRVIKTCLQDLHLTTPEPFDPVNRRKQLQAFPPNFIHSLDASHMLLSALECDDRGLTFAAVHDSFWTHACDVGAMSDVLRDAFIRIHSEDVIGRLAAEFRARYRDSFYLASIKSDSEVGKKIKEYRHNKSHGHQPGLLNELKTERDRLERLKSIDPEEVRQAREMITPATIFAAHASEMDLASVEEEEAILADVEDKESSEGDSADATEDSAEAAKTERAFDVEGPRKTSFEQHLMGQPAERLKEIKKKKVNLMHVWVPLAFPDIPKKGEFDVRMLKESKYFFS